MAENSARESSVPMLHMHPAQILNTRFNFTYVWKAAAALHQGTPGQLTWLEDPPPWLRHAYCFASVIV